MITRRHPSQPKGFVLPKGYTFDLEAESQLLAVPTVLIPGFGLYGGADFSQARDGAGVEHVACCARRAADNWFGFMVFRKQGAGWAEQRLDPPCTGRGEIAPDLWTGALVWGAWTQNEFFKGVIPGAVPYVPYPELVAKLAAVTSKAANVEILMHKVEEAGIRTQWALEALAARVNGIAAGELTDEELAQLRVVRVA